MGAHRKTLDVTPIANYRWRTVAREYLLARIAPRHRAGLVSLAEVGQHHCDTYLEEISWTTTGTRRRMGPAVVAALVRCTQVLALYSDILSDTYTRASDRGGPEAPTT